ncbi:MAG: multicopper oxidase domain-containing protein [Bacteroidota bacterium]
MKHLKHPLFLLVRYLFLIVFLTSCSQDKPTFPPISQCGAYSPPPVSYAQVVYTRFGPEVINPSGASSIDRVRFENTGTYKEGVQACQLTMKDSLTFTLLMKRPSMVQVAIQADIASKDPVVLITVNGAKQDTVRIDLEYEYGGRFQRPDKDTNYLYGILQIERFLINEGVNRISLKPISGSFYLKDIKFLPRDLYSEKGTLATTIYTQFGETDQVTGTIATNANQIWTRAYGLSKEIEMIPGPALYFNPGDLICINMVNRLNPDSSEFLSAFEKIQGDSLYVDEQLAPVAIHGEINIPHNFNNTNLHVHGLHVDPSKDDVTIVIVPEGASPDDYDAPHSNHPVSNLDSLNEYSVADQSVKPGIWQYQYKIPPSHLPGTHWFHPHKHGATSAQVENGLAGALIIQDSLENSLVPFSNEDEMITWRDKNDLVFSIQEITNYAQFGKGNKKGEAVIADPKKQLDLTVNGINDYSFEIKRNQLQRWRLINAGTNHRSFSHVWLGRLIEGNTYQSTPIYLAAVDGITLSQLDTITAGKPALLAPGNRSDFLVQLDTAGTYRLFKNYNLQGGLIIQDKNGNPIYNSVTGKPSFYPAQTNMKNNPYLFAQTGSETANYYGFEKYWVANDTTVALAPLIQTKPVNDQFLDVTFAVASDFKTGATGWQPITTGGQITDGKLFDVTVSNTAATNPPAMPTTSYLEKISPVGMGDDAPAYVSKIDPEDVLQSRPVIFDVAGISVKINKNKKSKNVNQFTLNGRFFILNDPIGNTKSDSLIQRSYQDPKDLEYEQDREAIARDAKLSFTTSGGVNWKNTSQVGKDYYFTNPGYYQQLKGDDATGWTWDTTGVTPSWAALTGIQDQDNVQRTAIINEQSTFYEANKENLPNLPLATTAEEWILINNSDVGHPFHIHINPFFVVEVGQLSYEQGDWYMRAVTAQGEPQRPEMPGKGAIPGTVYQGEIGVNAIVGNWWDTIIIPPHGYVKVRYWFNVPNQTSSGKKIMVADNFNKVGIWVYHCHILRHEDRGMMMPVITQTSVE